MLSIFRTNQLTTSVFLILYIVLVRISDFTLPLQHPVSGPGMFSQWVYQYLGPHSFPGVCIAAALVFLQALGINYLFLQNRITQEATLFGGLFYCLIAACIPDFMGLSPVLMANTFLLLALYELFETYRKHSCAPNIFNAGFWIATASLFYSSYLLFLPLAWVSLGILRSFRFQERLMVVAGIIAPYFLLFTWYFWHDKLPELWDLQFARQWSWLDFAAQTDWTAYFKLGVPALLLLIALFNYSNYGHKKSIQTQKYLDILYWTLLLGVVTPLFQTGVSYDHLLVMTIPLSFFMAISFTEMPRNWAEATHIVWMTMVVVLQFIHFLL